MLSHRYFFSWTNRTQKRSFFNFNIVDREEYFLDQKSKVFKKSKKSKISALEHGFCQKIGYLLLGTFWAN